MKVAAIMALSALAFSCTASAASGDAAFVAAAKAVVTQDLKDPESVKFKGLGIYQSASGLNFLCGEMNAKNSYGAYTGYVRFVSAIEGLKVIDSPDSEMLNLLWPQWCYKKIASVR